jgi:hypothetical protein
VPISRQSNINRTGRALPDGSASLLSRSESPALKHCGYAVPAESLRNGTPGTDSPYFSPDEGLAVELRRLNSIAFAGLMRMFNPEVGLFCHRMTRTGSGFSPEGISPRYTIIALLGLHRLEAAGYQSPLPIAEVFETLLKDSRWVKNIGDIGLMLWLSAMACPEYLERVVQTFNVREALASVTDSSTIDLANFLAGVAHHSAAETGRLSNFTDQAVEASNRLKENQGETGIFGHCARSKSFSGIVRGRIGSFADQSYSIYALAKTARAFSFESAATAALDCALTMCQLQGPLGQWWWHYDAITGRVVGRYPVFSVHQAGTAPMALMELGNAIQSDFTPWIERGVRWITGDNELGQDLCDSSANIIAGYICRDNYKRYLQTAFAMFTKREEDSVRQGLTLRHEWRPYHIGWLLYAFGNLGLG